MSVSRPARGVVAAPARGAVRALVPREDAVSGNVRKAGPGRWLSGLERRPTHQKVVGSVPGQAVCGRQPIDVSLSPFLSLNIGKPALG